MITINSRVSDFTGEEIRKHIRKRCQVDHFRHWTNVTPDGLRDIFLTEQPEGSFANMVRWLMERSEDYRTYLSVPS